MENAPRLPLISLILAGFLGLIASLLWWGRDADQNFVPDLDGNLQYVYVLNELEITLTALAVTLAIFAVQGFISVLTEGRQLRPGRIGPRLSGPLTVGIFVLSLALIATAGLLGTALFLEWDVWAVGLISGLSCLILAILLAFYKEGFVGSEARFDDRDDGVPW